MAAPFAIPAVIAAMRTLLVADTSLTALLASFVAGYGSGPAVYAEAAVPARATFPYVTIGAPTEIPFNTMGTVNAGGSECTIQVKAFSKLPNDDEVYSILSAVKAVLDTAALTVSGYVSADCQFEALPELFVENVDGVLVRQGPMIFRVYVHESA